MGFLGTSLFGGAKKAGGGFGQTLMRKTLAGIGGGMAGASGDPNMMSQMMAANKARKQNALAAQAPAPTPAPTMLGGAPGMAAAPGVGMGMDILEKKRKAQEMMSGGGGFQKPTFRGGPALGGGMF